jgi:alkylation response protein AidB-like acyl-CoA dehydrogenase
MDFEFTEEQRLLRESLDRLLGDSYEFAQRKTYLAEPDGFSRAMWAQYAELGLLGLPFAEEHGGFGGSAVDVMIVMEAFGRVLALEPYLATVVLAGKAIEQKETLIPQIADGSLRLAVAHGERQARYDLNDVVTTAKKAGSGWRLDGAKSVVVHGDSADKLIVSARISGDRHDPGGIGLFLVDAQASGVARRAYPMRDGTHAADIALSGVEAEALGEPGAALAVIEHIAEAAIAATSAEAVGAMETMLNMTVEYLKTRVQFGRPIGDNQALQHRATEMMIAMEQGRSLAMLASVMVDDEDVAKRAQDLQAARFVSQNAVQLHGGIGMTDEYAVGHYFRRCMVIEHSFGDTGYHLSKLAAQIG